MNIHEIKGKYCQNLHLTIIHCINCGSVVVDFLFIVTPIVGVCNCSMFCCYFMSILVLQSSWRGREIWLLCLICLPGVS